MCVLVGNIISSCSYHCCMQCVGLVTCECVIATGFVVKKIVERVRHHKKLIKHPTISVFPIGCFLYVLAKL